jgi:Protein of unknown function (DUF2752)
MNPEEIVRRPLAVVLIWLGIVSGAIYLFIFEPGRSGIFLDCPFRLLTGFNCPGCGTTRGLHHLLHGDLAGAFWFNPLMMLVLPVLLFVLVRHTIDVFQQHPIRSNQLKPRYIWMFFAVVMTFWIFRNTPFYPFFS